MPISSINGEPIDNSEIQFLASEHLARYTSVNLLNPNTSQRSDGLYAYYVNGSIKSNNTFSMVILPVDGGSEIVCSLNNCHICFTDTFNNIANMVVGNTLSGYISGLTTTPNTAFDVPSDAMYMVISLNTDALDTGTVGLYYGTENKGTPYEAELLDLDEISNALHGKLDAELGKNLFNKDTDNKKSGVFVNAFNGNVGENATYCAYVIPVEGGSHISFNLANMYHAAFFKNIVDISGVSAGGRIDNYISGFANESGVNRIVPDNASMMILSVIESYAGSIQVEYGSTTTSYQPYQMGLPASKVVGLSDFVQSGTLLVGAGMAYTTITDAVNAADDGDTILIMAGTYREAIDCRTKKIRLKGISRDAVTLIYSNIQYQEPPLEIANGSVEDMTIIADGQNTSGGSGAYCVHIDFDNEIGQSLQFKNVRFYNDALGNGRPCVGIGLRENFRLSFLNCEFESAVGETFYCHEQQASDKANQYVELIDCSIISHSESASEPTILLQETPALENTSATIRMQRCIVKNLAGGRVIGASQYGTHPGLTYDGYLGTKLWTLDPASALNSDDQLNA